MQLTHPDTSYWLAATQLEGVGPITLLKWLHFFGNIKTIFTLSEKTRPKEIVSEKQLESIKNINWQSIEQDLKWCEKNHCQLLTWADTDYPILLREIAAPPLLLYVQGDSALLNKPQLAIVGSRSPSATGLETAEQFAHALSLQGLVITSGLALGIDAACHRGAIRATGETIAVMGTGLKQIYPKTNTALAKTLLSKGAILSEFPLNAPPHPLHFPRRNRVISGLSLGVLVVEAALKSGSLITARFAADQGREVFAIPGSIRNPLAKGCHHLLQQGAKLVENIEDILLELAPLSGKAGSQGQSTKVTPLERPLLDLDKSQLDLLTQIGEETTALETIVIRSGLTPSQLSSMLLSLELKGYIDTVPGGYRLCR